MESDRLGRASVGTMSRSAPCVAGIAAALTGGSPVALLLAVGVVLVLAAAVRPCDALGQVLSAHILRFMPSEDDPASPVGRRT